MANKLISPTIIRQVKVCIDNITNISLLSLGLATLKANFLARGVARKFAKINATNN